MNRRQTGQRGSRWVVFVGLTVVLGISSTSGSSLHAAGPATQTSLDAAAMRVAADPRAIYDPAEVYTGVYATEQLYRVVLGSERWAGSRHPARVRQVTCRDARTALERSGLWTGPLHTDGTCGSGEPTDWATGNFLNFQSGLYHEDSDL